MPRSLVLVRWKALRIEQAAPFHERAGEAILADFPGNVARVSGDRFQARKRSAVRMRENVFERGRSVTEASEEGCSRATIAGDNTPCRKREQVAEA